MPTPDLMLVDARITTLDRANPEADAVLIRDGRFAAVSREAEIRAAVVSDVAAIAVGDRRVTHTDEADQAVVRGFHAGAEPPLVRHLLASSKNIEPFEQEWIKP